MILELLTSFDEGTFTPLDHQILPIGIVVDIGILLITGQYPESRHGQATIGPLET